MNDSQQEIAFHLVFDGRLVPGRNAAEVEAEFVRRFGAATAKTLFSGKPVTVNRNLRREDAQKKQRVFEQLGVVVQIVPSSPVPANLSLVEAPSQPTEKVEVQATPARQVDKPEKADFGVLPDRTPVAPTKTKKSNVYSKAELADAFKDAAEMPTARTVTSSS